MSWISKAAREWVEQRLVRGRPPQRLNAWQEAFCEWNAERLMIPEVESRERFARSWAALSGGHGGRLFRSYGHLHMEVCRPFWGNKPAELQESYVAHEPIQFLRLLSYGEPDLNGWPELRVLEDRPELTILDFGCGLAQFSTRWAMRQRDRGKLVKLFLADLPLLHLQFVGWLCRRWGLDTTLLECTWECPVPSLPACDLCIATELLEHVHDPMRYMRAFAQALRPGGLLLTNIEDHEEEFLHVSSSLAPLRDYLRQEGWEALRPNRVYRKPGTAAR